ncbi:hypothetical protein EVAR_8883_1 [Eumeta japonica]|uniref:Uncharacterized protein n=1 Tax=Eumeta variegata TaxID=151549 RepID=A0A4C1U063_EUMVA|nr:hypothetical protein EVAR_8883_1 [Eumeta japonica]
MAMFKKERCRTSICISNVRKIEIEIKSELNQRRIRYRNRNQNEIRVRDEIGDKIGIVIYGAIGRCKRLRHPQNVHFERINGLIAAREKLTT